MKKRAETVDYYQDQINWYVEGIENLKETLASSENEAAATPKIEALKKRTKRREETEKEESKLQRAKGKMEEQEEKIEKIKQKTEKKGSKRRRLTDSESDTESALEIEVPDSLLPDLDWVPTGTSPNSTDLCNFPGLGGMTGTSTRSTDLRAFGDMDSISAGKSTSSTDLFSRD